MLSRCASVRCAFRASALNWPCCASSDITGVLRSANCCLPWAIPTSVEITLLVTDATSCSWLSANGWKYASSTIEPCRSMSRLCTGRCRYRIISMAYASQLESMPCASGADVRHPWVGQKAIGLGGGAGGGEGGGVSVHDAIIRLAAQTNTHRSAAARIRPMSRLRSREQREAGRSLHPKQKRTYQKAFDLARKSGRHSDQIVLVEGHIWRSPSYGKS